METFYLIASSMWFAASFYIFCSSAKEKDGFGVGSGLVLMSISGAMLIDILTRGF